MTPWATPSTSRPWSIACWTAGASRHDEIPPALGNGKWHTRADRARAFDIEVAKQKLEAAGYKLDANGKRLDKDDKPIALRMVVPDSSASYASSAEFITGWWKELGST